MMNCIAWSLRSVDLTHKPHLCVAFGVFAKNNIGQLGLSRPDETNYAGDFAFAYL